FRYLTFQKSRALKDKRRKRKEFFLGSSDIFSDKRLDVMNYQLVQIWKLKQARLKKLLSRVFKVNIVFT
ncbi:unnamed protein product, partial [Larinioides sclopetarius]